MDNNKSFYNPSGNAKNTNRTYVPDLYRQMAEELQVEESGSQGWQAHVLRLQKRQIVGVLYSVSAEADGELFPIYVGRNMIGSDRSCDICLRETSVSAQHGLMLARKQTNDEGEEYVNVILADNNSDYGTLLNGEPIEEEHIQCADGDVISVGQNYVLVLSLFNALGKLSVATAFDRMTDEPRETSPTPETTPFTAHATEMTEGDHSTNITRDDEHKEASSEFYKPTKQPEQDHYNNKTIIL